MALTAAAEVRSCLDAFKRHCDTITANTSNPKILDATYELENIVMAMWPGSDDIAVSSERWRAYGLSPLMCRAADLLHSRMGRTVSREGLLAAWRMAGKDEPAPKDVDVLIMKIRRRIAPSPYIIINEWGVGFRMEMKPIPPPDHNGGWEPPLG